MKKHGIGKIVIWALALYAMLSAGVVVAIAFSLHFAGRRALQDIYQVQKNRAEELGLSMSKMAGGGLTPMTLVNISTAMHEIVEESSYRYENFKVEEMFLLDEKGVILAHNDITAVAKDSGVAYKGKEYSSAFFLPRQDPVRFTALNRVAPPPEWYGKIIYAYITMVYPGLAASKFHVAVSVFTADGLTPVAALHIVFSNQLMGRLLSQTIQTTVRSLAVGLAVAFVLTILITLLWLVRLFRSPVVEKRREAGVGGMESGGAALAGEGQRDRPSGDREGRARSGEVASTGEGEILEGEDEWLEISDDGEGDSGDLPEDMDLIGDIEVVTDSSAYEMERELGGAARIVDAIPLDPPRDESRHVEENPARRKSA